MPRPLFLLVALWAAAGCDRELLDLSGPGGTGDSTDGGLSVDSANPARPGDNGDPSSGAANTDRDDDGPGSDPELETDATSVATDVFVPPSSPEPFPSVQDAGTPSVVFCRRDEECGWPKSECHSQFNFCVECEINRDCPAGEVCTGSNQCVSGCSYSGDCPLYEQCDPFSRRCVECLDNSHCYLRNPDQPICHDAVCRPCSSSLTCGRDFDCVAGRCEYVGEGFVPSDPSASGTGQSPPSSEMTDSSLPTDPDEPPEPTDPLATPGDTDGPLGDDAGTDGGSSAANDPDASLMDPERSFDGG